MPGLLLLHSLLLMLGFIPQSEAWDNTTKMLNLLPTGTHSKTPTLLYLQTLRRHLTGWTGASCSPLSSTLAWDLPIFNGYTPFTPTHPPPASVKVNGFLSEPFHITNGTWQGCPLSLLMFVLSLKPFLRRLRVNREINKITVGRDQHKISA